LDLIPKNIKYINGVSWLIRLRWIAVGWVVVATFTAKNFFNIPVQTGAFYIVSFTLALENILSLILLKISQKKDPDYIACLVRRIINFQISFDLFSLTVLMHYSGGLENPVYFFFIFHIVISGILLSKLDSYLQTTYALLLLWALALLENTGLINHYDLWLKRSVEESLYRDNYFIIETLSVFTIASFILVYITNYIISLLRKQEEAYENANVQLQKKDKIKDEYMYRVTHNIKGHLAAIQMNLSIMADNILGPMNEKQAEFINNALSRTLKLTNFVKQLLKLSKARLSDKLIFEDFSIKEIINTCISDASKEMERKSLSVNFRVDDSITNIKGNPSSFEEMFSILLNNAIKYTQENGAIEIIVKDKIEDVLIEISDTGVGIPEDELPNIFNEFFRATNVKNYDGTGLGLALAKHIVERYGGDIWATLKETQGTVFHVVLPKEYNPELNKNGNLDEFYTT
jgi:signal transduction histidine kinase